MSHRAHRVAPPGQEEDDRLQTALLAAEVCVSATEAAIQATQNLWAAENEMRRLLARQVDELPAIAATLLDVREFSQQSALSWEAALSAGTAAFGSLTRPDETLLRG